jgi:hypothetical protein
VEVPLPWERRLCHGGAPWSRRARYVLTDFRLVLVDGKRSDEIAIHDIGEVHRAQSWFDRLAGRSTLLVHRRGRGCPPLVLRGIRRGAQVAALLELLAGDPYAPLDEHAVRAALSWEPRTAGHGRYAIAGLAAALAAVFGAAIGLGGSSTSITYPLDDAIYPNGQKRGREDVVRFMEMAVMPWARTTLARVVGGADRVTCATCHGRNPQARDWRMPAVAALPEPQFKQAGWEHYSLGMDAQLRNAIYGYLAESGKQATAAYMREAVLPGMARLLHRLPYDFTRPYDYNRTRFAFGCYHCHRVN